MVAFREKIECFDIVTLQKINLKTRDLYFSSFILKNLGRKSQTYTQTMKIHVGLVWKAKISDDMVFKLHPLFSAPLYYYFYLEMEGGGTFFEIYSIMDMENGENKTQSKVSNTCICQVFGTIP